MLSASLNRFVMRQARAVPYRVGIGAPEDFATLARRGLSDLEISPIGCDATIYGSPSVNQAFRAWHDATHIRLGAGFDVEGELRVARAQCAMLNCPFDRALLWADMEALILECGHFPSKRSEYTTGYGIAPDGHRHCYECCAKLDLEAMARDGRATLYLTIPPYRPCQPFDYRHAIVTNWPGSLRFSGRYQTGRHNVARKRLATCLLAAPRSK